MHQDGSQLNSDAQNIVETQDLSSKTWGGVGERPPVMVTPGFSPLVLSSTGVKGEDGSCWFFKGEITSRKVTLPCDKHKECLICR